MAGHSFGAVLQVVRSLFLTHYKAVSRVIAFDPATQLD